MKREFTPDGGQVSRPVIVMRSQLPVLVQHNNSSLTPEEATTRN